MVMSQFEALASQPRQAAASATGDGGEHGQAAERKPSPQERGKCQHV